MNSKAKRGRNPKVGAKKTTKTRSKIKTIKIVVTGGPSAGKTTLIETLFREFKNQIAIVPEAASILFKGGIPRGETIDEKIFRQRAIYFLQKELEDFMCKHGCGKIVLCDRGSLDALAYWPKNSKKTFFQELKTTESAELKRYDWVIHLDTASEPDYQLTSIRTEQHRTALELNNKIKRAWEKHPRRIVIPNSTDFSHKLQQAINFIKTLLQQSKS